MSAIIQHYSEISSFQTVTAMITNDIKLDEICTFLYLKRQLKNITFIKMRSQDRGVCVRCWGNLFPSGELTCNAVESYKGKNSFYGRAEYTDGGDDVITYSIHEVILNSDYDPKVEVERTLTECDGKDIIHVKVSVRSRVPERATQSPIWNAPEEKLTFYKSGAKNAVISHDGKTVKRMNELDQEGHGGVLTNRALNDNELFEVRIDRMTIKYDDSLGIGVTHHTPTSIDYLDWMPCGTIILFDHRIYEHGVVSRKKYGANLKTLRVGDRVGVMKKSNGDLHFYINGEDQGVARSNVTYPVHGVLDVYGKVVEVSIVS